MTVYHGTGKYSLDSLLGKGPRLYPRDYLDFRKAFSTTTDFKIAALFAFRRSPPAALTDESEMGVVVEYKLAAQEGTGWSHAKYPGVLQEEKEIAIFDPGVLIVQAVWRSQNGGWVRQKVVTQTKEIT